MRSPSLHHDESRTISELSILNKLVAALEGKTQSVHGHGAQNVIPEFDPQAKTQSMEDWLSKINESAHVYGWCEKQIIYYALPRLTGLAKRWYDGLTSVKYSWEEWQRKLLKAFPCEENYGDLLTEMLTRKTKKDEALEEYYYDKIRLINRCNISGQKAVDCLTHGIFDNNIRMNAQGSRFSEPEDLLYFFRKISTKREESTRFKGNNNIRDRPILVPKRMVASEERVKRTDSKCFNCGENGHFWQSCSKDVTRCGKCKKIGHSAAKCENKNGNNQYRTQSGPSSTKGVLKIESESNTCDKYFKNVKINGHTVRGFVDLGSECTILSDRVVLNSTQRVSSDGLPLLKGFANGAIQPIAKAEICIQIDDLLENITAYVVPNELLPQHTSILIGQNLTELPNVRVYKTDTDLILFKSMDILTKVTLQNDVEIKGTTVVPVIAEDCPSRTNLYLSSQACLKPNSEYFSLPGTYSFEDGHAHIVVIGLTSSTIKLSQGQLLARGVMIPEFIFTSLTQHKDQCEDHNEDQNSELKICRIEEQGSYEVIQQKDVNIDKDLDNKIKDDLCQLLNENRDCFAFTTAELGKTNLTEMHIKLKDDSPVTYRPYRMSFPEREKVKEMIEDLCANGIIRESESEYASPIIVVSKKTGDLRLCVDYRALNKKTYKDKYPMPLIEDQIDRLNGQKYFTTLDLASGYHQIPVAEDSKHLTAFITQDGHYEYNRMPFGLCNAPAIFQRLIHKILNTKKIPGVLAYMDDIVVASTNIEEGMMRLRQVLEALREANLTLKLKKCHFFRTHIEYLGYEISAEGVQPGQKKIEAVASFKKPTNIHEIRQFVGLASFFRRFVPGFATLARPLTSLTKSEVKWDWGEAQEEAFTKIKHVLISRPVLAIYNPTYLTEMHTDASQLGIGGILMQRIDEKSPLRAVAYFSRQTTTDEQHFHSYELETLAVVMSLNRFRNYLLGLNFKVVTDCNAVRLTWTKRDLVPRIARWWLQAQEFDFTIEYRPGTQMSHVDALSRNPVVATDSNDNLTDIHMNILKITKMSELDVIQYTDPNLVHLKCILDNNCADAKDIKNNYVLKDGKIYRKVGDALKWAVPQDARWKVCHMSHDECGHMSLEKTIDKIQLTYWFPQMTSFVKKYVKACIPCAYAKIPAGKKEGFLHPIPKAPIPFHTVHIDHLGPFVKSKMGNTYILGVIDGYTKFIILKAVRNTKSKTSIAVLREVFAIFGAPKLLISDRGTSFTSSEFAKFAEELEIKHIKNAVAMPRANGQIERYNRTVLASLAALTHGENDKEWDTHLNTVQWSLNNTLNKGINKTPSEVIFGRRTINLSEAHLHDITNEDPVTDEGILDRIREEVSQTIEKKQSEMKDRFDKKRCPAKEYTEGELVLVQKQVNNPGESNKLLPHYSGPYKITKILGNDRYEVSSIEGHTKRKYKNVYAADKMKRWISFSLPENDKVDGTILSDIDAEDSSETEEVE